ncbi:MerR family transcriptional regulator [Nocardia asteroides]|uniref:MerR family transcriptional regulator n=1 Tax=Nocardia asteroides TaxID=1824 RepID=UPI0033C44A6C
MTGDTPAVTLVSIGELARRTGLAVRTIRFYCDEGILESQRSAGGHRMFDGTAATERLLLVRRLRALGLGLEAISAVLRGERSIDEVVAAESARVDAEFRSLAWRRAALRAIGTAAPAGRAERLAVLAAAQDGDAAHVELLRFWQRVLAPIPGREIDVFVGWNVPEPPDPTVDQIVAYAELVALTATADLHTAVRHQLWRDRPHLVRDGHRLYAEVGDIMTDVVPRVLRDEHPHSTDEVDRYVRAHARARGERDSPRFRRDMLTGATDTDPRIHRYWTLTDTLLTPRVTVGRAHQWVYEALARPATENLSARA